MKMMNQSRNCTRSPPLCHNDILNKKLSEHNQFVDGEMSSSECLSDKEKIEYKRMKSKAASRRCRKRQRIELQEQTQIITGLTKEYTRIVTENYQLQSRNKELESENEKLKAIVGSLFSAPSSKEEK
eukprot:CAMPEP_0202454692 /NCGR_PEP_ID=MMETSP1360-20130828/12362_1 /ASSEMBLY_ACC=CAM_ASM_000848 /TAXON_ID=515479 /ORGANISM="Licmophora paradoxa, Strain CCMP2313" /LENGTH=126 /DNA_ID=CAMNT_0049074073 /DNA_START=75 /DNA_END=452 /DNA_ORIENTATION=+